MSDFEQQYKYVGLKPDIYELRVGGLKTALLRRGIMKNIFYCAMMFALLSLSSCASSNPSIDQKDQRLKDGEEIFNKLFSAEEGEKEIPIWMDNDRIPISMFVELFSVYLKIEMVVDDRIKSKDVSLHTGNQKTHKKEAWDLFVNTLWNAGAYCTLKEKTVYILPIKKK
ncbi:MAG: hypothetical protein WAX69_03615 [Victivallales bacterium]